MGEAPQNVSVTVLCNTADVLYDQVHEVAYIQAPVNVTGLIPVPLYHQCNISFTFSNAVGGSVPFTLEFSKCRVF